MTAHAVAVAPPVQQVTALHPVRAFLALVARDFRIIRRDILGFVVRSVTQPLLFVFVFSFVLPKLNGGGTNSFAGAQQGPSFATILVPGLLGTAVMMQGIMAVTTPLVMELSYTREIEDRALAPLPMWCLGVSKIISGAIQAFVAGLLVFPCVMFVHAKGQAPHVAMGHWPIAVGIGALAALMMASLGLLLGTLIDPRKLSAIFTIVMVPIIMLGCVYYPWANLHAIHWLQIVTLFNPLVYVSEALRAALVPGVPHLPTWAYLLVLVGGTAVLATTSVWTLARRLVD